MTKAAQRHVSAGLAGLEKTFGINPNHARGWATRGVLELLRARSQPDPAARQAGIKPAILALERAIRQDGSLAQEYAPLLAEAKMQAAP